MDIEVCGRETLTKTVNKLVIDVAACGSGCSSTTTKNNLLDAFSSSSQRCGIKSLSTDAPSSLAQIVGQTNSAPGSSMTLYNNYDAGQYESFSLTATTLGDITATIPLQIDLCARLETNVIAPADLNFIYNKTSTEQ